MSYVISFLPWIVFAVLPSDQWQWAALAGLVIAAGLIVKHRLAGRNFDSMIIEIASAVYFAALAALAFSDPDTHWHDYSAAFSNLFLAVVAGGSVLIRQPFTLGIAKQSVPQEIWHEPLFLRINYVITIVWTAAFAVSGIALTFIAHAGKAHTTLSTCVQIAGFAAPILFTARYVAAAQAKAEAQAPNAA